MNIKTCITGVNNMLMRIANYRFTPILTMSLFACMFALISFVNHSLMRTFALDLGLYTHALFSYAHLHLADCEMFMPAGQDMLLLSDHFDLYLILFSPLVYIFGQYTLLIIQILALLLGGWGLYKLIRTYTDSPLLPWMAMTALLGCYGVWQALGFDYHSNVVSASLLPWFLLFIRKRKFPWALVMLALMSISKETTALWLIFVVIALLFDVDFRNDKKSLFWHLGFLLYAVAYFAVISFVIMPSLGGVSMGFSRYSHLGESMSGMAVNLLTHPWQAVCLFFTNFTNDPTNDGLKLEFWICTLLSCGVLAFLKPNYLIMTLSPLLMKMLSQDTVFWGIGYQYNIEICFVIVAACFIALAKKDATSLRNQRVAQMLSFMAVLFTLGTTVYTVRHPKIWVNAPNMRVVETSHYRQKYFSTQHVRQYMQQIPADASVCASSLFVPHLALRDHITEFPTGMSRNPEYVLILAKQLPYYGEGNPESVSTILSQGNYYILSSDGEVFLLRRN